MVKEPETALALCVCLLTDMEKWAEEVSQLVLGSGLGKGLNHNIINHSERAHRQWALPELRYCLFTGCFNSVEQHLFHN